MFANRLKDLRNREGLTQQELAERLSLTRGQISMWESKIEREPSFAVLNSIADFFEVTTDYLTGRSDNPNHTEYENKSVSLAELKTFRNKLVSGDFTDIPKTRIPHLVDALDKEIIMIERELQDLKAQK